MPVSAADRHALDLTLVDGAIVPLFQPVVDLESGVTLGHEALARGPAGSPLESPLRLLSVARDVGALAATDWACRTAAFREALAYGLLPPQRLFVNAEPEALDAACPPELLATLAAAHRHLRIVVEITERQLLDDLPGLLRVVSTLRELGWEIALDDVGAVPQSLLLLPVVQPDIVKLDAALLSRDAGRSAAEVADAVRRHADRTGALVVAEGIETREHLERARALGAGYGQGWLLGRPGPLGAVRTVDVSDDGPGRRARLTPAGPPARGLRVGVRHGRGWPTPWALLQDGPGAARPVDGRGVLAAAVALLTRPSSPSGGLVLVAPGPLWPAPELLAAVLGRTGSDTVRLLLARPDDVAPAGLPSALVRDEELAGECTVVVVDDDGVRALAARPDGRGAWLMSGPVTGDDAVVVARALLARA